MEKSEFILNDVKWTAVISIPVSKLLSLGSHYTSEIVFQMNTTTKHIVWSKYMNVKTSLHVFRFCRFEAWYITTEQKLGDEYGSECDWWTHTRSEGYKPEL